MHYSEINNDNFHELSDDEFEKMMDQATEDAGDGSAAAVFEKWTSEEYPKLWHEAWDAGRAAALRGESRKCPEEFKVMYREWQYGYDDNDPHRQLKMFKEVENHFVQ